MPERFTERDALDFVRRHVPDGPARADVKAVLAALDPRFGEVMEILAGVALDVGRARRMRCVAVLLQFAAVQLADDLADDDCWYLSDPIRTGPGVQWMLQHLSQLALGEGEVDAGALSRAAACFVRVGAAQQREVRQGVWDLETAAEAARGLNGEQYAAYLSWLWASTRWQDHACDAGRDFGFCLHVVSDKRSGDRRWTDLSEEQQRDLIEQVRRCHQRLAAVLPSAVMARLPLGATSGQCPHRGSE